MINILFLLNIALSNSFLIVLFFRFVQSNIGWNKKFTFVIFLLSICTLSVAYSDYFWLQYLFTIVICTGYLLIVKKQFKFIQALFLAIFTIVMVSFINYTEQMMASIILQSYYHHLWLVALSNMLALVVNIVIVLKIPNRFFLQSVRFLEKNRIVYANLFFLFFLLILFISVTLDNSNYLVSELFLNNKAAAVLFISVGLFMILISLMISLYIEEKKDSEKLLSSLMNYTQDIERVTEELSMFRHDYTNLLYSLQIAINNENIEEIKRIYDDVLAPTQKFIENEEFELLKLNRLKNIEIKAVINMKLSYAKYQKLNVSLDIPEPFILDPATDLVTAIRLISVLLDNAIEASLQSDKKELSVAIFRQLDMRYMVITNSYNNDITLQQLNQKRFTSKEDGPDHGWGLNFVKKTIAENNWFDVHTMTENQMFSQTLTIFRDNVQKN